MSSIFKSFFKNVFFLFTLEVFIQVLKALFSANTQVTGLYNFINQQFLINEFPDAKVVNREDDLGQEGLRRAKTSYRPIRLEEKYHIKQKF